MHRIAKLCCAVSLALAVTLASPGSAAHAKPGGSGPGVGCDPVTGTCRIVVGQPGSAGKPSDHGSSSGSGGGGGPGCHWGGTSFPCTDPALGWFDGEDGCYYRLDDPQPPPGDVAWQGHAAGDGLVYVQTCMGLTDRTITGEGNIAAPRGTMTVWLADPPPGSPPPPAPPAATLAQWAEANLNLTRLIAQSNGGASQTTYVGIPTWVWITPDDWQPRSRRAAVATRAVTLTVTPASTRWDMGDGSTVDCAGPGTSFDPADPENPPCGHTYRLSSAEQPQTGPSPNDRYFTVQGSVIYRLHWICTGNCDQDDGSLPDMSWPTTPLPLRVLEVQTVTVNQ